MNPLRTRLQANRPASSGFTLIELLVAMTAGLFVAVGAFALAKQGSRFFQQEARVANAQFAATLGFDRLRADIARAGFLTTPNIRRDTSFFCGDTTTLPAGMKSLAPIRLTAATPSEAQDATNGLAPDRITLTGSYGSTESFAAASVLPVGTGFEVTLNPTTGAFARTNNGSDAGAGAMSQVFQAGRVLRILDSAGKSEFGRIDGYALDATGRPVISLRNAPPIPLRRNGNCGIEGQGEGSLVNVVNFIRYEIRNLRTANLARYAPLYDTTATAPGDQTRLELVRVELDADGNEIADTLEIVAEYAVDLRFGLTVVPSFRTPTDPDIASYPIGDARNYNYAFDVATNNAAGPERIRGVRARLVVRSREADRIENLPVATPGNIFRYAVAGGGFARARTLTADVQLPNLTGVTW